MKASVQDLTHAHVSAVLRAGGGRADSEKGEKETAGHFGNTENSTFRANAFIQKFDQILPVKALCFYREKKKLQRNTFITFRKTHFWENSCTVRFQTQCLNMCPERSKFVSEMQKYVSSIRKTGGNSKTVSPFGLYRSNSNNPVYFI